MKRVHLSDEESAFECDEERKQSWQDDGCQQKTRENTGYKHYKYREKVKHEGTILVIIIIQ